MMALISFETYTWCKILLLPDLKSIVMNVIAQLYHNDIDRINQKLCNQCDQLVKNIALYQSKNAYYIKIIPQLLRREDENIIYTVIVQYSPYFNKYLIPKEPKYFHMIQDMIEKICLGENIQVKLNHDIRGF